MEFFNYVIHDLICGYFREFSVSAGRRYYIVIENDEYRNQFMQALRAAASPCTVSGIYTDSAQAEEPYETYQLEPGGDYPAILIGCDSDATEDYLTTMRNAVGTKGSRYENYCLLFVLANSSLSSILTTCQNLQGVGAPLSADYIISNIRKQADTALTQDKELFFLKAHLDDIARCIADGTCSLFDFRHALTVLKKGTLRGHYGDLEFFPDSALYESLFALSDADMKERVEDNHRLFRQVSNIMNDDDDTDKRRALAKLLDDKLAKNLVDNEHWLTTDWKEIQAAVERRESLNKLEVRENHYIVSCAGGPLPCVVSRKGGLWKHYLLVYAEPGSQELSLEVRFNRRLKAGEVAAPAAARGDKMLAPLTLGELNAFTVNSPTGSHEFAVRVVPCPVGFFREIESDFIYNKAGEMVVKVPAEADKITFGSGEAVAHLPLNNVFSWQDGTRLEIPVLADEEEDSIDFSIFFGPAEIPVQLKLNASEALLPMTPADADPYRRYLGETYHDSEFARLRDGEKTRVVNKRWRWYLETEKRFIDTGLPYLECTTVADADTQAAHRRWEETPELRLPAPVARALQAIFAYFRKLSAATNGHAVPSLTPPDEELEKLYAAYCESVLTVIRALPSTSDQMLTPEEYNLTHLGVVKDLGDGRVYLSPFHPLMVAYRSELRARLKQEAPLSAAHLALIRRQLTPFYLIPYLRLKNTVMRPVTDGRLPSLRSWVAYEPSTARPQVHINDITKKAVTEKMQEFIGHFSYLFQNRDCPIIVGTIGFEDDADIVKGIFQFILEQYKQHQAVQRIELHEYVANLTKETFFEKLNRLNTADAIMRELEAHGFAFRGGELSEQQLIHFFFTRVSFYKHAADVRHPEMAYCHVAFYRMSTEHEHVDMVHGAARCEMGMKGLISATSTTLIDKAYFIGFGSKYTDLTQGRLYPMVAAMNTLYANEKNQGQSAFNPATCIAKYYRYSQSALLADIYENANWVTFINPEVDVDFFYNQKLYIVHYTDQGSINAKYDSITVTKHIRQYENILRKSYDVYALDAACFAAFNERMMNYFNCLNGSWMLSLVNKTEMQIREKMSIVAASIALERFLRRVPDVIWVPISLEEVLRVTGAIRLPMEHIFSKKSLGASGSLSDDLLMMGLHCLPENELRLYFYPVEVKCSKNNTPMVGKGGEQVCHTYKLLRDNLMEADGFINEIYRTFFASVFLSNAEKLVANKLMPQETYEVIEHQRYRLLNAEYRIAGDIPTVNGNIGKAAVISFHSGTTPRICTSVTEDVEVCEIHFSEKESYRFVADPASAALQHLDRESIEEVFGMPADMPPATESLPEESAGAVPAAATGPEEKQPAPNPAVAAPEMPAPAAAAPAAAETIRILVGHAARGGHPIVFEPANTRMVSHPNMGIIGTMGTGKTQFARSLIAQLSKEGRHNVGGAPVGVLVFDYKGDYKDEKFLSATGGAAYKFNFPFNPLKLVLSEDVAGMNLPAITADRISDSFAKAYGLGLKQQSLIKQTIIATYEDAGITRNPDTWAKPVPTMAQVIEKYFSDHDANDKSYALFDKLRDYTIFAENNEDCVSLFEWLDRVRVIDLTLYPDDTKKVIVSLILDLFYAEMRQLGASRQENGCRELRAMIMVDEAHQFLKKDFMSLRNIISEGRMFGVGMILSTQNIGDFKSPKEDYSQFILSWVIHHVNSISRAELTSIFSANDPYADTYSTLINKAGIFESVCKIGNRVESMKDFPFYRLVKEDPRFPKDS